MAYTPDNSLIDTAVSEELPLAEPEWDYSGHIVHFLKAVVNDSEAALSGTDQTALISSLKNLLNAVESHKSALSVSLPKIKVGEQLSSSMPPLDAAVAVLRWAKGQLSYFRKRASRINII